MGIGTNTEKYGTVTGNLQLSECNDFVDAEKQDYRIKSGTETAKRVHGILTDEFDIEKIGLIRDVKLNEETAPFKLIYPKNGAQAVQCSELEFEWEQAFGASNYRLIIAEDPELEKVVYDEVVPYTLQKVEGLAIDKIYYWKVSAINRSREFASEWESQSGVYVFSTSIYDSIDTSLLNTELTKISEKVKNIDEGNGIGQYPLGTTDKINSLIKRAEMLKKAKLGILKQKTVDSMAKTLSLSLNKLGMVNKGFLNINKYIDSAEDWGGKVDISGDTVSIHGVSGANKVGGTKTLSATTGSCLYSFDAMVNTEIYAIIAFSKYIDMEPYSAANTGYSICIKDDLVELQLSTGNSHSVIETVYKSFANDGEYHRVEFGFINTQIGNLVVLYVDGEPWFEYPDIFDTSVKCNCELSMFVVAKEGELISIKPTQETSSAEEFDECLIRNLHKSVKLTLDKFKTTDEVILFKDGATKIFSPKGVFDVSYAPNKTIDGKLMMAFDKVGKIFGVETAEENGNCYINYNGKQQIMSTAEENGYKMVSVEEVLKILDRASVPSAAHGMIVAGNIIYMNNVEYLNKAQTLMELLKDYKQDYLF